MDDRGLPSELQDVLLEVLDVEAESSRFADTAKARAELLQAARATIAAWHEQRMSTEQAIAALRFLLASQRRAS